MIRRFFLCFILFFFIFPDDFRIFAGDLGNEVTEDSLARAFNKYPSFLKCKIIRDKRTNKTRGYGFISFRDPNDFVRAIREMNGKYHRKIEGKLPSCKSLKPPLQA